MLKIFTTLLLFFLAAPPLWAAAVEVEIPSKAQVKQARISLGDIAEIKIHDPQASALAEQIKNIDLGLSPQPGEELAMSRAEVENKIIEARLILSDTIWYIPDQLNLTRPDNEPTADINEEKIRKLVLDYLSRTEPYRSGDFKLISLNMSPPPRLSDGNLQLHFVLSSSSNPLNVVGYINYVLDGRAAGRSRVNAQVDLKVEALVALRSLSRGQIVKPGDVGINLLPYDQAKDALSDPALAVGNTLKVNVEIGEAVKERQLSKSVLVRRGEIVTILARQGGLTVSASGQAKQDGAMGDTIAVVNLSSNKTLSAKVIGPSQVEIIF